jgi:hypothetical protein
VLLSDFHPEKKLGGGGAIAYEFHQLALENGHQSRFWYTGNENRHEENERCFAVAESRHSAVKYLRQTLSSIVSLRILVAIYRTRPEIVWIHQIGNSISYSIIFFLRLARIPTIVTLHDYLVISSTKVGVFDPRALNILEPKNLLIGNRFREEIRRFLLKTYVNFASKIFTVSNIQQKILSDSGVNCTLVMPNGASECSHTNFNQTRTEKKLNVLFAGRFHRKGLEYLIEGIIASPNKWVLHLAGNEDLLEYAHSKLPAEQIRFHGRITRSQLHTLMHEMHLVSVLSQYFDPYPTVGLEAIRHGSMFLTTNSSGISSLLVEQAPEFILKVGEFPNLDCLLSLKNETSIDISLVNSSIPTQEIVFKKYFSQMSELLL